MLLKLYKTSLSHSPILTKSLTSLTGFTLGDILAQNYQNTSTFDYKRTLRMGMFGFLLHGPTGHYFYNKLDLIFPGTSAATVIKKVLIDQTIWNPIFGLMYFTYLNVTTEPDATKLKNKIINDLPTAVTASWSVWVPAHAVNFRFVSGDMRIAYINVVQVGYNVFLSLLGNKGGEEEGKKELWETSGFFGTMWEGGNFFVLEGKRKLFFL